jgi:hypothetical protein
MLVVVTGRISAALHIQLVISAFLRIVSGHISLSLLTDHITYNTLLALEVIANRISLIRSFPVLKNRSSLLHTQRILYPVGIYRAAIHIHGNNIGRQFYLLIIYFSLAIQMRISALGKHNRVVGFIGHRSIQRLLFLAGSSQRIHLQRIGLQGIAHTSPVRRRNPLSERIAPQRVRLLSFGRHNTSPTTLRSSLTGKKK